MTDINLSLGVNALIHSTSESTITFIPSSLYVSCFFAFASSIVEHETIKVLTMHIKRSTWLCAWNISLCSKRIFMMCMKPPVMKKFDISLLFFAFKIFPRILSL